MIVSKGISGWGPLELATFCAQPVPAQHTAMRSPPSALAAASTAAWTWVSSRTSQIDELDAQLGRQSGALVRVDVGHGHDRALVAQAASGGLAESRGPAEDDC